MRRRGFTMIEAALVLFLFSVIALTFYQLFSLGTKRILDVRRKLGATALASKRMEMVRSLPYDSIGTKRSDDSGGWTYGIPPGDIIETETTSESGGTFTIHTVAQYVDDAFDEKASGSPADTVPTDYKRIRIEVSWVGTDGNTESVATWSTFSPDGVEQPSNTGVLSVNVLNASGIPVQDATIHIVNTASGIDLSADTDAFGNQSWPGAPPSTEYSISVSKSGYYGVQTYPAYPTSTFDPLDPSVSVVSGSVNQKTFAIDRSSDITVRSEDPFGTAIPNVGFTIAGGHQVGTKPLVTPLTPVYDFSVSGTTASDGEKAYPDRCYGRYSLSPAGSVSGYRFLRIDPGVSDVDRAFDVVPGTDQTAKMVFADTSLGSLLFSVTKIEDSGSGTVDKPVSGAVVRLRDAVSGYDVTVTTGPAGQAYFPTSMPALPAGTYEYEISATGYSSATGSVTVTGSDLQDKPVTLTAV